MCGTAGSLDQSAIIWNSWILKKKKKKQYQENNY